MESNSLLFEWTNPVEASGEPLDSKIQERFTRVKKYLSSCFPWLCEEYSRLGFYGAIARA
jgi:hypothetical protein